VLACNPHLPGCCTLIGIRPIRWWFAQYLLARKHRGYPQAHEDDAPRALRAALDIAEAVDQLELSILVGRKEEVAILIKR
jgi:hypothetical protein